MRFQTPGIHIAPVIICVLALSALPAHVAADPEDFAGGDGSAENPYQITDWYELDAVRDHLTDNFVLMNDLDSTTDGYGETAGSGANSGAGWQPIGNFPYWFAGSLDGQGHEIADLVTNRPGSDMVGLFGAVGSTGALDCLSLVDCSVQGDERVGSLVGENHGSVSRCYAEVGVEGWAYVSGLVGWNQGSVDSCYSICSVNCIADCCGGALVGRNEGAVSDSYGVVVNNYYSQLGGLVGCNLGTVSNSFFDAEASAIPDTQGGTEKTTPEMLLLDTFTDWDICEVAPGEMNPAAEWNIVDRRSYPFLSCYRAQFDLRTGWNMVSVPAGLPDGGDSPADVFGDEIEAIYFWDPVSKSYTVPAVLEPNCGYWVAVLEDKVVTYMP